MQGPVRWTPECFAPSDVSGNRMYARDRIICTLFNALGPIGVNVGWRELTNSCRTSFVTY